MIQVMIDVENVGNLGIHFMIIVPSILRLSDFSIFQFKIAVCIHIGWKSDSLQQSKVKITFHHLEPTTMERI